jgi:hypothetical protein
MPLEIKELHIRVSVNQPEGTAAKNSMPANAQNNDDKQTLVNHCIEQVMEILNKKNER